MAEMHTLFIETNLETRLALLLHKDDHVSAFKDKFCKEHVQCFPNFGEITVSSLKVNWKGQYYHLSDSMILSKAFEGFSSEWFVFVDVVSVEEKRDPTQEEVMIDQENGLEKDNQLPNSELYQSSDAENEGFIDGVDATTKSIPNSGGEKVYNTLLEAIQNDKKVDNGEKDGVEPKPVKPKEDTLVDSTAPNLENGGGENL